jgi:hypothetical protein
MQPSACASSAIAVIAKATKTGVITTTAAGRSLVIFGIFGMGWGM